MNIVNYFPTQSFKRLSNPTNGDVALYTIRDNMCITNGEFIEFSTDGTLSFSSLFKFIEFENVVDFDCLGIDGCMACVVVTTLNDGVHETSIFLINLVTNVILDCCSKILVSFTKKQDLNIMRADSNTLVLTYCEGTQLKGCQIDINMDGLFVSEILTIVEELVSVKSIISISDNRLLISYLNSNSELIVKFIKHDSNGFIDDSAELKPFGDKKVYNAEISSDFDTPLLFATVDDNKLMGSIITLEGKIISSSVILDVSSSVDSKISTRAIDNNSILLAETSGGVSTLYRIRRVINSLEIRKKQIFSHNDLDFNHLNSIGRNQFILSTYDDSKRGFYFYKIDCCIIDGFEIESQDINELISIDALLTKKKMTIINHHNMMILYLNSDDEQLYACTFTFKQYVKHSTNFVDGVALDYGCNDEMISVSIPNYFSREK